jgi:hypothetical protein
MAKTDYPPMKRTSGARTTVYNGPLDLMGSTYSTRKEDGKKASESLSDENGFTFTTYDAQGSPTTQRRNFDSRNRRASESGPVTTEENRVPTWPGNKPSNSAYPGSPAYKGAYSHSGSIQDVPMAELKARQAASQQAQATPAPAAANPNVPPIAPKAGPATPAASAPSPATPAPVPTNVGQLKTEPRAPSPLNPPGQNPDVPPMAPGASGQTSIPVPTPAAKPAPASTASASNPSGVNTVLDVTNSPPRQLENPMTPNTGRTMERGAQAVGGDASPASNVPPMAPRDVNPPKPGNLQFLAPPEVDPPAPAQQAAASTPAQASTPAATPTPAAAPAASAPAQASTAPPMKPYPAKTNNPKADLEVQNDPAQGGRAAESDVTFRDRQDGKTGYRSQAQKEMTKNAENRAAYFQSRMDPNIMAQQDKAQRQKRDAAQQEASNALASRQIEAPLDIAKTQAQAQVDVAKISNETLRAIQEGKSLTDKQIAEIKSYTDKYQADKSLEGTRDTNATSAANTKAKIGGEKDIATIGAGAQLGVAGINAQTAEKKAQIEASSKQADRASQMDQARIEAMGSVLSKTLEGNGVTMDETQKKALMDSIGTIFGPKAQGQQAPQVPAMGTTGGPKPPIPGPPGRIGEPAQIPGLNEAIAKLPSIDGTTSVPGAVGQVRVGDKIVLVDAQGRPIATLK